MKPAIRGLYFVTDPALTLGRTVEDISYQACKAGINILQFRNKEISDAEFLQTSLALRRITSEFKTIFIINDRVNLVEKSRADGLHIGQSDLPAEEARKIIGDCKILGVSFNNETEAAKIRESEADYAALSPVFSTETKKDLKEPRGLEGVRFFSKYIGVPLVAIGGINLSNISEIISSGADSAAVVTAISLSEDIKKTVGELRKKIREGFESRNFLH